MSNGNVAVLGLGTKGTIIAQRLLAANFKISVWDRNPARATPFVGTSALVSRSSCEAASQADMVIAALSSDSGSREAWTGSTGAFASMAPGSIAVESSDLSPRWMKRLIRTAEIADVSFLEAPIIGNPERSLAFLVAGHAGAAARAAPVFAAMASPAVHLGDLGSSAFAEAAHILARGRKRVDVADVAQLLNTLSATITRSLQNPGAQLKAR